MELNSLQKVQELEAQRKAALEMREIVNSGMGALTCKIVLAGKVHHTDKGAVSTVYLRQAIIQGCTDTIIECERQLAILGCHTTNPEPTPDGTLEQWKLSSSMYQMAWTRELGPRPARAHLIDSLVIGTRLLRAAATEIKPLFGAPVSEPQMAANDCRDFGYGYLAIDTTVPGGVRRLDPATVRIKAPTTVDEGKL